MQSNTFGWLLSHPASNAFFSHQISTSHHPTSSTFFLQQISTSHQAQPAEQNDNLFMSTLLALLTKHIVFPQHTCAYSFIGELCLLQQLWLCSQSTRTIQFHTTVGLCLSQRLNLSVVEFFALLTGSKKNVMIACLKTHRLYSRRYFFLLRLETNYCQSPAPATSSSSSQPNSIFLSHKSSSSLPNAVIVILQFVRWCMMLQCLCALCQALTGVYVRMHSAT